MTAANATFTLSRTFKATPELLWQIYTQPEHFAAWFGPQGFTLVHSALDLRVGGQLHYGMRAPNGVEMWGKWTFVDLDRPRCMVVIQAFSDAQGGTTRHPMAHSWPLQTLAKTTFTPEGEHTRLDIEWTPWEAEPAEVALFAMSHDGMRQGWGGTLDQLDAYLAQLAQAVPPALTT